MTAYVFITTEWNTFWTFKTFQPNSIIRIRVCACVFCFVGVSHYKFCAILHIFVPEHSFFATQHASLSLCLFTSHRIAFKGLFHMVYRFVCANLPLHTAFYTWSRCNKWYRNFFIFLYFVNVFDRCEKVSPMNFNSSKCSLHREGERSKCCIWAKRNRIDIHWNFMLWKVVPFLCRCHTFL